LADFGDCITRIHRRKRMVALGLLGVQVMLAGPDHDEEHPQFVAARVRMRNPLRGLVAWASRADGI